MAAPSTTSRTNSRVNYSNEIHDLSTVQSGSAVPTLFYPDKSIADIFPPHLGKKVRRNNCMLHPVSVVAEGSSATHRRLAVVNTGR